jgi:hypothetical protein
MDIKNSVHLKPSLLVFNHSVMRYLIMIYFDKRVSWGEYYWTPSCDDVEVPPSPHLAMTVSNHTTLLVLWVYTHIKYFKPLYEAYSVDHAGIKYYQNQAL